VPGEDRCRVVGEGPGFTHVHTSPDGRFWVADCNRTADIFVGTVDGGRMRRFCASGASFGAAQYTHPHPFFLGDGRSIGWNSDATGVPQVYCARIPDWFLESLRAG
jgi:Tol biopolymer transport system component